MDLHANVAPFQRFLGTWSGEGHSFYPTIEDLRYRETLTLTPAPGKPFVRIEQKTASESGLPMHVEVGYLRFGERGHVELVLAQPTGQTELLEGTFSAEEGTLALESSHVVNSSTAKTVTATKRFYRFTVSTLHTQFHMAAGVSRCSSTWKAP